MKHVYKNSLWIVVAVLAVVAIPTISEFLVALHNRYATYPAGTDTNMLANYTLVEFVLAGVVGWFLGTKLFKTLTWRRWASAGLVLVCLGFVFYLPSFIPPSWCKYELSIYPCDQNSESGALLFPEDVKLGQIREAVTIGDHVYFLVMQPNLNFYFPELVGEEIIWHGVLKKPVGSNKSEKFFTINNPVDPEDTKLKIKYNPIGVFEQDGDIYIDIVNDRGAGSGEGQLVRLVSSDGGVRWQKAGCYYYTPEKYFPGIGLAGEESRYSKLDPSSDCIYELR